MYDYDYDYDYNSGEEDAYESERQAYEREAQAERERECQAIVAARIREAFEAEVSAAWGVYYNRMQKFNEKGVQRQQTLATALLSKTDSTLALFAMDRPKVVRGNLKHVKEYLVAPPTKIFQAAHLHIGHVVLDEVVLSKQASPLHFDVEIKKVTSTLSITMLCDVLKAHLDAEYRDYEPSIIGELVDAFCEVAVQDWEEEECASGLKVIKGAITKVLRKVEAKRMSWKSSWS
ncbi:unnamed protein product [Cylindrotheca closterium]|uniref:Uncharacterized protein n=1 Tax=Cylindrotheca closterium TaxID=2856 RepID=A0AAD2JM85_9STRA|nr:unnamed protein product [Cylindrotheca closterium]CAJ1963088.1 unnamed protein product [Cylindrotheca closterium]